MLFTVVGDPHLTHKSFDRARDLFAVVEQMGMPTIWLGDMLDTKEVIRGKCFNLLLEYFRTSKLQHFVLVGNHDYFNLECQAHSLEALKLLHNVQVIDEPTTTHPGVVMFPYFHDKAVLLKELARFQHSDTTLFAHLEVSEFDFGNGHLCTTGITLDALKGFKRVVSGHFHKYQALGNLVFLGTPYSQSFGEANQTKFLGLYDTDSGELKIAETPFPKHVSLEVNCDIPYLPIHLQFNKVDYFRVILNGTQANIDQFPRQVFSEFNVKWIARPSDHVDNSVQIEETASNERQFTRWATEIKRMDPDTVKLGLEILEACK